MKLYATVTSERASKGQGGNERVEAEIRDEEKQIAVVRAIPDGTNTRIYVRILGSIDFEKTFSVSTGKGEKQKGECNGRHESVQAILDCHICQNDPLLD